MLLRHGPAPPPRVVFSSPPCNEAARVWHAPVPDIELSDEFCLREEEKLDAVERRNRASSRSQREHTAPTSYSDEQAEAIIANEEAIKVNQAWGGHPGRRFLRRPPSTPGGTQNSRKGAVPPFLSLFSIPVL